MKIGITCYPLIGGSGILATALGHELARREHEVHFFSSSKPIRLDLTQPRISFHEVVVNEYSLFRYPDYTLPLAVKMARVMMVDRQHRAVRVVHGGIGCQRRLFTASRAIITSVDLTIASASSPRRSLSSSMASAVITAVNV